ncbi:MAG: carbohydrate ABC transporter permease [Deltaproteobacteria bacterium]|nr:carbohydrate ABC transporter permease [SAR324 cluster bacterium]NBR20957.1 carbohydrate ABC transporter permease [Pseudomonadota bacterium]MEC7347997.1 carbohydrate ABC transporter permease [SAR324 cluster bacterium]MEC7466487.1 carbohydrate ABC transporter permease [SAR324 cluster bacterium]MEC7630541.1 carbohydrate ABC transporter permease [SAR324 cluster bacterium]
MEALERSASRRRTFYRWLLFLILGVFAIYYLAPMYVMIVTSFKSMEEIRKGNLMMLPKEFLLDAWKIAWGGRGYDAGDVFLRPFFWNSTKMVVPAVVISTFLGAINGYILTKWRFKGDNIIFLLFLFGCFIPYQAILLPMARTLGALGISNSITGLVLVHSVYGLSFTTLFFRNYYVSIPDEMIKAARIDGAGFFKIFFKVLLPISAPIIVVTVIWQFTNIWNDFLFGSSFSFGEAAPIQVALNNMVLTSTSVKQYNVDMAAAFIAGFPTLVVYILAGKYFIRGLTAGSVKG